MRNKAIIMLALVALALLSSCAPASSPENPSNVTLASGTGGLSGQVSTAPERWSGEEVSIFAAPFTRTQDNNDGFYVLEPNIHPHALLDKNGIFQIVDMPPGEYVLIVGPNPREGKAVLDGNNHPRVFVINAGEIIQAGELSIAP